MKKFNSINEIRKEIDKVDQKILDLISKRRDLVVEVVKVKKRDQIIDKKRIKNILERLKVEAENKKLPKDLINDLWKLMIGEFIKLEEKIFDEVHKN